MIVQNIRRFEEVGNVNRNNTKKNYILKKDKTKDIGTNKINSYLKIIIIYHWIIIINIIIKSILL